MQLTSKDNLGQNEKKNGFNKNSNEWKRKIESQKKDFNSK